VEEAAPHARKKWVGSRWPSGFWLVPRKRVVRSPFSCHLFGSHPLDFCISFLFYVNFFTYIVFSLNFPFVSAHGLKPPVLPFSKPKTYKKPCLLRPLNPHCEPFSACPAFAGCRIGNQQAGEALTCKRQLMDSRRIGTQFAITYCEFSKTLSSKRPLPDVKDSSGLFA
jgi:hypothetical protein